MSRVHRNGSCSWTLALGISVLAAVSLTACGGVPQSTTASAADDAASSIAASSAVAPPVTGPGTADGTQQATLPSSGANASESSRTEGRPESVPLDRLPGMSGEQVVELLGTPQFSRGETIVELWQYRGDSCVLHLFLYRAGDALRVRHAEVRSKPIPGTTADSVKETGPAANTCLAKLAAAHTRPTS